MGSIEKEQKKGTTTLALVCKDGVVIASDRRAAMGYLIASKTTQKIFKISNHVAMTIAGSAADGQKLAEYLKAEMQLYRLGRDKEPTLTVAANMLSNIVFSRAKSFIPYYVQLILAGQEEDGSFAVYNLDMGGSTSKEADYTATGSGSPMAFGVLEDDYTPNLSSQQGMDLARRALMAAIKRDLASGDGIQIAIVDGKGYREVKTEDLVYATK
jgi:proteasome beta subunit